MEIQTIFRDIVIQSFLNLGCYFCDICQFIFRYMGYFSKYLKGDWILGIALPVPQIYLVHCSQ